MVTRREGILLRTGEGPALPTVDLWPAWHARALCHTDHQELFLHVEAALDTVGRMDDDDVDRIAYARAVCKACPVLDLCDKSWRDHETGSHIMRAGLVASLTPKERAAGDAIDTSAWRCITCKTAPVGRAGARCRPCRRRASSDYAMHPCPDCSKPILLKSTRCASCAAKNRKKGTAA